MKIFVTVIFVLVAACFMTWAWYPIHQEKQGEISSEEYEVYSVYLDGVSESPNDGGAVKQVVVNSKTIEPNKSCLAENLAPYNNGTASEELKPLMEDLLNKSKEAIPLQKRFTIKQASSLLDQTELSAIFKASKNGDEWKEFYKRFPNSPGYISLSRVGFNFNKSRAILYSDMSCGGLCGSGDYILFEKNEGKWKVVKGFSCWIS